MPLNGENFPIENVANPAREDHAANKRYVDDKINSLSETILSSLKSVFWATAFTSDAGFGKEKTAGAYIGIDQYGYTMYYGGTGSVEVTKTWRRVDDYVFTYNDFNPFAYNPAFNCIVKYQGDYGSPAYGFIGVGFLGDGTGDPDFTKPHFGFKFQNDTGDYVALYATNANGTSQTHTSFWLGRGVRWHRLKAVMSSDNIKFYRNGELVATHTTNLPIAPPQGEGVIFYMAGYREPPATFEITASSFIYLINS